MFWLLYRIDFDVLGTSINAEQNPEAKEQIEKIRTLTVSIHQEEVKSLRILQHWDVFIMSSRFSCFKILRCTCRYCKCNTGIISFIFFHWKFLIKVWFIFTARWGTTFCCWGRGRGTISLYLKQIWSCFISMFKCMTSTWQKVQHSCKKKFKIIF